MRITNADIATAISPDIISDATGECVHYVIDSRKVCPGSLFIACQGEHVDGHDYIGAALSQGAVCVLGTDKSRMMHYAEQAQECGAALYVVTDIELALAKLGTLARQRFEGVVVGITGSTGKTSTKELMSHALSTSLSVSATVGNQNNELGVPLTLLNADTACDVLIVEMGMRGLNQIASLCEIARPKIGVITSIGPSHIELLGSVEAIAQAKSELFQALPADGTAIYSVGSPWEHMLRTSTRAQTCTVSMSGDAGDVQAHDVSLDDTGCAHARVTIGGQSAQLVLSVPGLHQLSNALLVVAVGHTLGIALAQLVSSLGSAKLVGMRFVVEHIDGRNITLINDAYNANPVSMAAALETFGVMQTSGRKIAVLGDMLELGDYSESSHRSIGSLVASLGIDALFTYGKAARFIADVAKSEDIDDVWSFEEEKMNDLITALDKYLLAGDAVLVKGSRGMALERVAEAMVKKDVC